MKRRTWGCCYACGRQTPPTSAPARAGGGVAPPGIQGGMGRGQGLRLGRRPGRGRAAALPRATDFLLRVQNNSSLKPSRLSGLLSTAQGVRHVTMLLDTRATHCFICARLAGHRRASRARSLWRRRRQEGRRGWRALEGMVARGTGGLHFALFRGAAAGGCRRPGLRGAQGRVQGRTWRRAAAGRAVGSLPPERGAELVMETGDARMPRSRAVKRLAEGGRAELRAQRVALLGRGLRGVGGVRAEARLGRDSDRTWRICCDYRGLKAMSRQWSRSTVCGGRASSPSQQLHLASSYRELRARASVRWKTRFRQLWASWRVPFALQGPWLLEGAWSLRMHGMSQALTVALGAAEAVSGGVPAFQVRRARWGGAAVRLGVHGRVSGAFGDAARAAPARRRGAALAPAQAVPEVRVRKLGASKAQSMVERATPTWCTAVPSSPDSDATQTRRGARRCGASRVWRRTAVGSWGPAPSSRANTPRGSVGWPRGRSPTARFAWSPAAQGS